MKIQKPGRTYEREPRLIAEQMNGDPQHADWPKFYNLIVIWIVRKTRELGRLSKTKIVLRYPAVNERAFEYLAEAIPRAFPDLALTKTPEESFVCADSISNQTSQAQSSDSSSTSKIRFRYNTPQVAFDLVGKLPEDKLHAVQIISEKLSRPDLLALVGKKSINSLRSLSKLIYRAEPSLSKESLAAALLIKFGYEIFAEKTIREVVAKRFGVNNVKRWVPGKNYALRFVREIGVADSFAGTPSASAPQDTEWVSGRVTLPELADFQKEVLQRCSNHLSTTGRCIMTLPTGAGKTRTAVELLLADFRNDSAPQTCIWVAHTQELLEQAVESVRQVWSASANLPTLRIDRRFANHSRGDGADEEMLSSGLDNCQLVVTTPQRILNDLERWETDRPELLETWVENVSLVVIDEAHRAAAPQYKKLLNALLKFTEIRLLGLTATPFRKEYLQGLPELGTLELYDIFRNVAEPIATLGQDARQRLQERKVLAYPHEKPIQTGEKLGGSLVSSGAVPTLHEIEAMDQTLASDADHTQRRSKVFMGLLDVAKDPTARILYFGPSVEDAEVISFMLRSKGITAGFVSGTTRSSERRRLISQFRSGELQALCNCEVLTTGFDSPQVSHVVIARPTVSHVLFEQMVGRGLRGPAFGGTETCQVINFIDDMGKNAPALGYNAWRQVWGVEDTLEHQRQSSNRPKWTL